jgi:hypothetical protein
MRRLLTLTQRASAARHVSGPRALSSLPAPPPPPAPPAPPAAAPDTFPISTAGSWYDPNSIERRLRRKRSDAPLDKAGVPMGRVGMSVGALTEEEAYYNAGAPGYERGAAAAAPAAPPAPAATAAAAAAAATATAAAAATAATEAAAVHAEAAAAAATDAATSAAAGAPPPPPPPRGPRARLLRISSGAVSRASLPALARVWQLLALPAYAAAPGCVSARLVVGEEREGGGGGGALGPRGGLASVTAITEWDDEAALDAVAESGDYRRAMEALGSLLRGVPTVATLGQEEVNVWRRGGW